MVSCHVAKETSLIRLRLKTLKAGDTIQWQSICLACTKPWIWLSAREGKKERRENKERQATERKDKSKVTGLWHETGLYCGTNLITWTGQCYGLPSIVLKQTQKKVFIILYRLEFVTKESQDRGQEAGSRADGGTLLTGLLPLLVLCLLSCIIQVHLLTDGTTHNELSPLTSIITGRQWPTASLTETIPPLRLLL